LCLNVGSAWFHEHVCWRCFKELDEMKSVEIFVGGLPEKPEPPLNYRIVFSLEDVVNEYLDPYRLSRTEEKEG